MSRVRSMSEQHLSADATVDATPPANPPIQRSPSTITDNVLTRMLQDLKKRVHELIEVLGQFMLEQLPMQNQGAGYSKEISEVTGCLLLFSMVGGSAVLLVAVCIGDSSISTIREGYLHEHELPSIGIRVSSGYSVEYERCTVPQGRHADMTCTSVPFYPCTIEDSNYNHYQSDAMCLPAGTKVRGTFGHDEYTFVRVTARAESTAITKGNVNVFIKDRFQSMQKSQWHSFYHNIGSYITQKPEMYFKYQRINQLGIDGVSELYGFLGGDLPNTSRRKFIGSSYDWQYLRLSNAEPYPSSCFMLYLRSSLSSEKTNWVPAMSVFDMFGALGGHYTASLFVAIAILYACTWSKDYGEIVQQWASQRRISIQLNRNSVVPDQDGNDAEEQQERGGEQPFPVLSATNWDEDGHRQQKGQEQKPSGNGQEEVSSGEAPKLGELNKSDQV